MIFGLVDTLSSVPYTIKHRYKLLKPNSAGIRSSFFCERVVNAWNNLPADIKNYFSSIRTFKRSINSADFFLVFCDAIFHSHSVLVVFMFYCFSAFVSVSRAVVSATA